MVNESNGQRAQGQVQGCALRLMVNESNGQWTQGQTQGQAQDLMENSGIQPVLTKICQFKALKRASEKFLGGVGQAWTRPEA